MDQLGLPLHDPVARHDPPTSRAAVERLKASGALKGKRALTLRALARWIGEPPTSKELAAGDADLRYEYAKRLPELRDRGLVLQLPERECKVSKQRAHVWRLTINGCIALRQIPTEGPVEEEDEDHGTHEEA